jgi:hypothetical protein
LQFEGELKAIMDQMEMNEKKLSNHKIHAEKVAERNINDCWASSDVENKIRIQKLVSSRGIT